MSETPAEVAEVIKRFDEGYEQFSEADVSTAFRQYLAEHPERGDELAEIFLPELLAFEFYLVGTGQSGPWDTSFAPIYTRVDEQGRCLTTIDEVITPRMVAYWKHRCCEAQHPVLVARYADLVWDLSRAVTGEDADVKYARTAIDAYVGGVVEGNSPGPSDAREKLSRALNLALSINDAPRLRTVSDTIVSNLANGEPEAAYDLLIDNRKVKVEKSHEDGIISGLEMSLAETSDHGNDRFHPFGAKEAAVRLARYYRRNGQVAEAQRVVRACGNAFEHASKEADPMLALAWLQDIHDLYQEYGMRDDAKRIRLLIKEKGRKAQEDMPAVGVTVKVSNDEIEEYVEAMTEGGLRTALLRIASSFVPDVGQAQDRLQELATRSPLLALISVKVISGGQIAAGAGSVKTDADARLVLQLAQRVQIENLFLTAVIDRLREHYCVTTENVLDFLYESPVYDADRRSLIAHGLEAYERGDYISAVHVLIPQIECALRRLLKMTGQPVNKPGRAPGTMEDKNLNDILREQAIQMALGEDIVRYLLTLLADKRGLNIRNRVAHGFMNKEEFTRTLADRVFHTLLVLALVRGDGEDPDAGASSHPDGP